jgi:hypothetical protein
MSPSTTNPATDPLQGAILVAPLPDVGSEDLAEALASGRVSGILDALAGDVVVVPVVRRADGGLDTRVFPAGPGSGEPHDLCLFSSAATLDAFLGASPERLFIIQHGAALVDYCDRHGDSIGRVVFDPAGPNPMAVAARDLVALKADDVWGDIAWPDDDEDDDEDDEDEGEDGDGAGPPEGLAVRFDVPLTKHWRTVPLADEVARDQQIRRLVKDQTRVLGDKGASLRRDLREWFGRTAEKALAHGGVRLAFMTARTEEAAAAISLTQYWHDLGAPTGAEPHIDRVASRLLSQGTADDEFLKVDTPDGRVIRHVRVRQGAAEVGGGETPLLLIDYWLAAPGGRSVAQVSFSTPHLLARDSVLTLADTIVADGDWAVAEPPDAADPDQPAGSEEGGPEEGAPAAAG